MYTVEEIKIAIMNKWDWEHPALNIPILLWGAPGLGKTWIIFDLVAGRKLSELCNLPNPTEEDREKIRRLQNYSNPNEIEDLIEENLLVLRLAERPIEQLEGVPAPDFANRSTCFLMPENSVKLTKSKWVVIFVDELDKASESKMAAATHLIENRQIGDFKFPLDTMVIAAANRVSDSWLSKPVSPELCNRMAHVELGVDIDGWIDWAKKSNIRKDIIRFHEYCKKMNKNWLAKYPDASSAEAPRQFPTPRMWHKTSLQMDRVEAKYKHLYAPEGSDDRRKIDSEMKREAEQLVGEVAASELFTYIKIYLEADVQSILNGTRRLSQTAKRENLLPTQYIYACAYVDQIQISDLNNPSNLGHSIQFLEDLFPEIQTVFVKMLSASNEDVFYKLMSTQRGEQIVSKILGYVNR